MKNYFHITEQLLKRQGYNIKSQLLKQRLISDHESGVLPITNTLDFFNIKNLVANVPKKSFEQLPNYFIAQVNELEKYNLVLVDKTQKNEISILSNNDSYKENIIVTKDDFLTHWSGLIIAVEENKELKFTSKIEKNVTKIGLLICTILLISYVAITTQSTFKTSYLITSLIGLVLSVFIIEEKFRFNETPTKYCTFNKYSDCRSVLDSSEAIIFNTISLSDITIIYFSFITLSFLFVSNNISFFILALGSIPIIIYSLYTQKYKIKKWCPLCLGISSILLIQLLVLSFNLRNLNFSYSSLLLFSCVLLSVSLLWNQLKELLVTKTQNNSLVIENLTFRRNHNLFTAFYNTLQPVDTKEESIEDISLTTNSQPIVTILFITNPLCSNCRDFHQIQKILLEKYTNELELKIRFLVPSRSRDELSAKISQRLFQLYSEEKIDVFLKAYNEVYEEFNGYNWLKKWNVTSIKNYNEILQKQFSWCMNNEITSTPSILINGKIFPESYHIKDIINFVEPIIEFEKNEIKNHA